MISLVQVALTSSEGRDCSEKAIRREALRVNGALAGENGLAIVSGKLKPGHVLEGEIEASSHLKVSRTTYREADADSRGERASHQPDADRDARERGGGMGICWIPTLLTWMFSRIPRPELIHGVFELRTLVEPAAAALAAKRRKQQHLDRMRQALDEIVAVHARQAGRPQGRQRIPRGTPGGTGNPFHHLADQWRDRRRERRSRQFKQRLAKRELVIGARTPRARFMTRSRQRMADAARVAIERTGSGWDPGTCP
jgi:DNA-binding FadR family transcriptional regulator